MRDMTVEEYVVKYQRYIWWMIRHRTNLDPDDQQDRFQDVCMVICEKIDKLNSMSNAAARKYIGYTAYRMPQRHTWGNGKFMTIQDWEKWRDQHKDSKESADGLDWIGVGGKYRPDSEYWDYLARREKRELAEDTVELNKQFMKLTGRIKRAAVYGNRVTSPAEKKILKQAARVRFMDPVIQEKRRVAVRAYRKMNEEKIKDLKRDRYETIMHDAFLHAEKLARDKTWRDNKKPKETDNGTESEK